MNGILHGERHLDRRGAQMAPHPWRSLLPVSDLHDDVESETEFVAVDVFGRIRDSVATSIGQRSDRARETCGGSPPGGLEFAIRHLAILPHRLPASDVHTFGAYVQMREKPRRRVSRNRESRGMPQCEC
jgi:hypothetical protein